MTMINLSPLLALAANEMESHDEHSRESNAMQCIFNKYFGNHYEGLLEKAGLL